MTAVADVAGDGDAVAGDDVDAVAAAPADTVVAAVVDAAAVPRPRIAREQTPSPRSSSPADHVKKKIIP